MIILFLDFKSSWNVSSIISLSSALIRKLHVILRNIIKPNILVLSISKLITLHWNLIGHCWVVQSVVLLERWQWKNHGVWMGFCTHSLTSALDWFGFYLELCLPQSSLQCVQFFVLSFHSPSFNRALLYLLTSHVFSLSPSLCLFHLPPSFFHVK